MDFHSKLTLSEESFNSVLAPLFCLRSHDYAMKDVCTLCYCNKNLIVFQRLLSKQLLPWRRFTRLRKMTASSVKLKYLVNSEQFGLTRYRRPQPEMNPSEILHRPPQLQSQLRLTSPLSQYSTRRTTLWRITPSAAA